MIRRRCSLKKYAWNTATGKSPLIINNSEKGKFRYFSIIGNTEQETTTGAQLFNKETRIIGKVIDNTNGNEVENDRYACSDFIEIPQGVKNLYQTNGALNQRAFYDKDKVFISNAGTTNNTVIPENAKYIRISSKIDRTDMSNIMLNIGEIAKPFESYTECKSSPSPDYPQEIKNVGKWNEETQKYEVDVKVTGKNIIDDRIESWQQGGYSPTGEYESINYRICLKRLIRIKNTEQIFLDTGNNNYTFVIRSYDKYKKFARSFVDITANKPITLLPNEEYISVSIQKTTATQINLSEFNDMRVFACYFGMNNSYSEYTEQTLTLTSERPIIKWDKLVERDGQIGWLYGSKNVKLSGTETYNMLKRGDMYSLFTIFGAGIESTTSADAFCNYLKKIITYDNEGFIVGQDNNGIYCYLKTEMFPEANALQNFMTQKNNEGSPAVIYYKSNELQFVPLPQSEQDAVRSLTTYSPTTVIRAKGGKVIPTVEVIYLMEE